MEQPPIREGVCVGGPKAGQYLAFRHDYWEVAELAQPVPVSIKDSDMPVLGEIKRSYYKHYRFGDVGIWLHESIVKTHSPIETMIAELAAGYHPRVA